MMNSGVLSLFSNSRNYFKNVFTRLYFLSWKHFQSFLGWCLPHSLQLWQTPSTAVHPRCSLPAEGLQHSHPFYRRITGIRTWKGGQEEWRGEAEEKVRCLMNTEKDEMLVSEREESSGCTIWFYNLLTKGGWMPMHGISLTFLFEKVFEDHSSFLSPLNVFSSCKIPLKHVEVFDNMTIF